MTVMSGAACACCGENPRREGELTCGLCAGYEDRALDCPHCRALALIGRVRESPDDVHRRVRRRDRR